MREKTCCFTGHREITDNKEVIESKLNTEIVNLINEGVIYFGVGGARGFDTLAALTIIKLRVEYPVSYAELNKIRVIKI